MGGLDVLWIPADVMRLGFTLSFGGHDGLLCCERLADERSEMKYYVCSNEYKMSNHLF